MSRFMTASEKMRTCSSHNITQEELMSLLQAEASHNVKLRIITHPNFPASEIPKVLSSDVVQVDNIQAFKRRSPETETGSGHFNDYDSTFLDFIFAKNLSVQPFSSQFVEAVIGFLCDSATKQSIQNPQRKIVGRYLKEVLLNRTRAWSNLSKQCYDNIFELFITGRIYLTLHPFIAAQSQRGRNFFSDREAQALLDSSKVDGKTIAVLDLTTITLSEEVFFDMFETSFRDYLRTGMRGTKWQHDTFHFLINFFMKELSNDHILLKRENAEKVFGIIKSVTGEMSETVPIGLGDRTLTLMKRRQLDLKDHFFLLEYAKILNPKFDVQNTAMIDELDEHIENLMTAKCEGNKLNNDL